MIIFKTFLKLVNKNKGQLILYTVLLVAFTCLTLSSNDTNINYTDSLPDVIVIDNDNTKLSNHLKKYFKEHAKVKENVDNVDDELFYRFSSYAIYIPKGFEESVINNDIKEIEYKSVNDYEANLASILLNKYLSALNIYKDINTSIDDLTNHIDNSLKDNANIVVNSSLDTNSLTKAGFYYSFLNYSLLAGCIYILVIIISIFRKQDIFKRNVVSAMNYTKLNRNLLLSSLVFGIIVWLIYVLLSFIIVGEIMMTSNGLCIIALSFVFLIYCLAIGFLIANILTNKNAINGIITTISLGTSFICGVFISAEFLPSSVLNIAKLLPNYYYVDGINKICSIENISLDSLSVVESNVLILSVSSLVLIILTLIISKKKRKLA